MVLKVVIVAKQFKSDLEELANVLTDIDLLTVHHRAMVTWSSGNGADHINEISPSRARLVLKWVTVRR